jgi:YidC/Oxa1 family membrane protein insertase
MILAGVLSPIEQPLEWGLEQLGPGKLGLSYAWAIVALTVIVRLFLVPLMVKQIHSMQSMQRHMPELKALKEKYKDDKKRQQEEQMKFFRENKINPAASCLPMLLQFPIMIALYFVLIDFSSRVEVENPSDLSWFGLVPDITAPITDHWSGWILLVIYVLSQMGSSYFMTASAEKAQRILMIFMPLIFVGFIIKPPVTPGGAENGFPTGLLMYWMTTNLWVVGQGLVTRKLIAKPVPPPKKSSRTPPSHKPTPTKAAAKPTQPARPQVRKVKRKKKGGR